MAVIQVLSIVTIFNWIRSWAVNKVVENTEYKILSNPSINELLNVKFQTQKYSSRYQEYFWFIRHFE